MKNLEFNQRKGCPHRKGEKCSFTREEFCFEARAEGMSLQAYSDYQASQAKKCGDENRQAFPMEDRVRWTLRD